MTEKTEQERDEFEIATVEETDRLTPGTWVIDADGDALCLVDTHMGFPQRMWMVKARKGRVSLLVDLPSATFPVHEAEIDPDFRCEHRHGKNEMGHCYVCGQVVGELRPVTFSDEQMAVFRAAAAHNARIDGKEQR